MNKKYLKFVYLMSDLYSKLFWNVWWYSAFHEKNVNRFQSYHNLVKKIKPKNRFVPFKAVVLGIRKYFVFFWRKIYFGKYKYKNNIPTAFAKLIVSYPNKDITFLYDKFEAYLIVLPQRKNWKNLAVKTEREWVIDDFVNWFDLLKMPVRIFCWAILFLLLVWPMRISVYCFGKNIFGKDIWSEFKEEIWRSFFGDILVEGLYYDCAFKNVAKIFNGPRQVFYPYEGRGWEKALCRHFTLAQKVGILSSIPAKNVMHYHYHPKEVMLMPKPDKLGVPGEQARKMLAQSYGKRIFILGTTRYNYLLSKRFIVGQKKDAYLVVLGGVKEQAQELLFKANREWRGLAFLGVKKVYVSFHSDNEKLDIPHLFKLENGFFDEGFLNRLRKVMVFDSTVAVEMAALGIEIVVPELPNFIDLCPLEEKYREKICDRKEILDRYFIFNTREEMREILTKIKF